MQELGCPADATSVMRAHGRRALPEELGRGARGEIALAEVMLTLAQHQEEQARTAADLLARETWALTMILERSAPIWRHLPDPTLRFVPDHPDAPHLEVGCFSHLAALISPSMDEQALIAATVPCWAQVSPAQQRRLAGQTGLFARSYVLISVAEAVTTLGFGRILAHLEVATRTAGQTLLTQAEVQRERQAQLLRVERMLGVEPEPPQPPADCAWALPVRLLLCPSGFGGLALSGVLWGIMAILVCVLFGIPQAVLGVVLRGAGLLVWYRISSI